jgi:mRNA interferase YafQ
LREVREAEAQYAAGSAAEYEDVEDVIHDLTRWRGPAAVRFIVSSAVRRRARKLREPQASMLRAALRRFAADPKDPLLRTHKLKGDLGDYWAFSVDRDLRVLLRWEGDTAFLVALGSPDEAYW